MIQNNFIKEMLLLYFFFIVVFSFLGGCAGNGNSKGSDKDSDTRLQQSADTPTEPSGRIISPSDGEVFSAGDIIEIDVSLDEDAGRVSSSELKVDNENVSCSGDIPGVISWDSSGQPVGNRRLRLIVDFEDGNQDIYSLSIVFKSDIVPDVYTYRIINSYPHDMKAFTQGLVYESGYLYESTGQYGRSTLRKVDLETGRILRSLNLDRELFGEGLCIHDDKLYQLTWKSRVGFIYDKETFDVLRKVAYESEGWGLTSDGQNLLKSDGSNYIYVLEPQYFSETDRIEVYDNEGRVGNLNELEFIDGKIYANVFGTDEIVIIERETGKVTGIIDLTGLLDRRYRHPDLDVLNGIAYDSGNDRLFVTGKNWPRLFEIEMMPE
ncbi:MAG: glutaminyl-peptide cyclotransferase [Bacteroidales bacterium]